MLRNTCLSYVILFHVTSKPTFSAASNARQPVASVAYETFWWKKGSKTKLHENLSRSLSAIFTSNAASNEGQPVADVAYVSFWLKKGSKTELHGNLLRSLSAGFSSSAAINAGQPVANVAYVSFWTKEGSKTKLHGKLFRSLSAGFSSPRKFCKLFPQRLRWPFREEVKVGSTQQQEIVQFRGSRQHHVKVQPPFIIFLRVSTTLLSAAVNDHAVAHCSSLASC